MEIEMKHISKSFGNNKVLRDINFSIHSGEVHALMGENGAGKSTMMNILTGLLNADGGEITVDGKKTTFKNALDAEQHGIAFIHQEMNNFADMSVVENMFLNRELKKGFGVLDTKAMKEQAKTALDRLGVDISVDTLVGSLSVGRQQTIEIAKSLMNKTQVLIMDEPTAALSENEIAKLFKIIDSLREQGVAIIYISHRMEEIFEISNRLTVMRDGLTINTYETSETDVKQIVHDMVGRDMGDFYPERKPEFGKELLSVKGLNSGDTFKDIDFSVKSGEILAFSGLMGAGRTEIMRGIFGVDKLDSGEIFVDGEKVEIKTPEQAIKHNIGFLTENRKDEGLILDGTLSENIDLPSIDGFTKKGFIDEKADKDFVDMLMKRLGVKAQSSQDLASSLSGGNQQKVVLAKWVGSGAQILILDEPTRGVDVGAKREIYDLMNELTDRGTAIIMVSSDLDEVLGFSDNIVVVYEGKIQGEIATKDATQDKVMTLATGGEINE
ncbi:ABC-type sugar transport system, ATPase component [Paucilactobacillus oligofermentans DSM 15707 = LMG 22743]|uniref:ABC-type sugar transport system, ATPase component n=1 Tax=Paucilactobacillus oligofermentans DSM 15707 = LMG 22743 TaxID=1423778 RepID=A0A0R1RFW4_9LACO|nr:sugar ABC transporter ATP-binding protein [Paucilactobacillus oligofermentans]KRL55257.1 ABC-type sugar transport system, ATPase component [Paucilactobacillus oligofermentans DSM 15707 = LMG 22743]